ncbi:hypothetical protein P3T35_007749 [Kitasatospora sp. GP30]|uniref:DUF4279 domain-containing protein n=1 Tax=Kitasatospora sp. GP30 TaxID=3035084 RepID=UPI00117E2F8A|nr:DUF4279 domain-containing protein [Kitasatospora sp. GP30]MDH6145691.1 hypothetical protein [Kitasatospora sp. GP30]
MPDDLTMQPPMPDTKWSAGSLRITSRTISAADISARLGIIPDQQFEQGSLTSPRNPNSLRREASVWIRGSGLGNDRWLDEHVAALLSLVDGHREELLRLSADCDLVLFLGFGSEDGQGGCVLPARMLAEIGALGVDVILDLYPPTPEVAAIEM